MNARFYQLTVIISSLLLLQSCSLMRQLSGTSIDSEKFMWDRRAKAASNRVKAAAALAERLSREPSPDNADLTMFLSVNAIDSIVKQYRNSTGWLDENTSYKITGVEAALFMGSADARMFIEARNKKYDVDVELQMNCILSLSPKNGKIYLSLEPYDISPFVKSGGVVSSIADDIIQDLIKVNLSQIGNQFPDLEVPVDFANSFTIEKSEIKIHDKLNLDINFPKRKIDYNFKLREILILDNGIFIAMMLNKMEISK